MSPHVPSQVSRAKQDGCLNVCSLPHLGLGPQGRFGLPPPEGVRERWGARRRSHPPFTHPHTLGCFGGTLAEDSGEGPPQAGKDPPHSPLSQHGVFKKRKKH